MRIHDPNIRFYPHPFFASSSTFRFSADFQYIHGRLDQLLIETVDTTVCNCSHCIHITRHSPGISLCLRRSTDNPQVCHILMQIGADLETTSTTLRGDPLPSRFIISRCRFCMHKLKEVCEAPPKFEWSQDHKDTKMEYLDWWGCPRRFVGELRGCCCIDRNAEDLALRASGSRTETLCRYVPVPTTSECYKQHKSNSVQGWHDAWKIQNSIHQKGPKVLPKGDRVIRSADFMPG